MKRKADPHTGVFHLEIEVGEEEVHIRGIPFAKVEDFSFPRGRLNIRQAVWCSLHFATTLERKR